MSFSMKIMKTNREAPHGTPRSDYSVCLCPIKRATGLFGLIRLRELYYRFYGSKNAIFVVKKMCVFFLFLLQYIDCL